MVQTIGLIATREVSPPFGQLRAAVEQLQQGFLKMYQTCIVPQYSAYIIVSDCLLFTTLMTWMYMSSTSITTRPGARSPTLLGTHPDELQLISNVFVICQTLMVDFSVMIAYVLYCNGTCHWSSQTNEEHYRERNAVICCETLTFQEQYSCIVFDICKITIFSEEGLSFRCEELPSHSHCESVEGFS